jgi:Amidohydrolase
MHIDIHCHTVPQPCMGREAVGEDRRTYGIKTARNPDGKLCTVVDTVLNRNREPEQLWDVEGIPKLPSEYWKQLYFDTLAHAAEALQYLVRRVGDARILLATDYPFDMGDVHPVETIRGLAEVSDVDKASMLGQTAQALFKIRAA